MAAAPLKPLWRDGFAYKPHQVTGIEWMLKRETGEGLSAAAKGGILCDEMGLGKTIQMLGLLKNDPAAAGSESLLIAPVSVLQQWEQAAKRSGVTVYRPHTTKYRVTWEKVPGFHVPAAPRLYVIGYELARRRPAAICGFQWRRVICDEAHRLCSAEALQRLVTLTHSEARWMLTATPIVNRIGDLHALLELVGLEHPERSTLEELEPVLREMVLARSMDQLRASIADAPPRPVVSEVTLPFATEDEAEFYRGIAGGIVKRFKALEADGGAGAALMKLQLFLRLRQISLHPQVYIDAKRKLAGAIGYDRPDWTASSTKFDEIKRMIGADTGRKWILFCHFHTEMELLKTALEAEPWARNVWSYSGLLNHGERSEILKATHEPLAADSGKADILLIQLQSGGVGLNLQHFSRIIFSGPWWTAALMEQAIGRAVRIGQQEVVRVYHLKLEEEAVENIDAIMMEKATGKGDLCRAVLQKACRDV